MRGTLTKIETEGQNNIMERAATIQFLEQQIKELNLHVEHKNNEIKLLTSEMIALRDRNAKIIAKLMHGK